MSAQMNSEMAKHIQGCNSYAVQRSETHVLHKRQNGLKRVVKETIRIRFVGDRIRQASMQPRSNAKASIGLFYFNSFILVSGPRAVKRGVCSIYISWLEIVERQKKD